MSLPYSVNYGPYPATPLYRAFGTSGATAVALRTTQGFIDTHIQPVARQDLPEGGTQCPICHASYYDAADNVPVAVVGIEGCCKHLHCKPCLVAWLAMGKTTCPMCRFDYFKALDPYSFSLPATDPVAASGQHRSAPIWIDSSLAQPRSSWSDQEDSYRDLEAVMEEPYVRNVDRNIRLGRRRRLGPRGGAVIVGGEEDGRDHRRSDGSGGISLRKVRHGGHGGRTYRRYGMEDRDAPL